MKFSILVPVYNKLECLKKYFAYIQKQSFEDYEIIVIDDCSTDGSFEYIRDLSKLDKRIRLYRNEKNLGLGKTRNVLLEKAQGEYVIFVDPDDYIEIDLLRVINSYLDLNLDVIRFQNIIEPVGRQAILDEKDKDKFRYSCLETDVITGEEALLKWHLGERKINTFPWTYAIKRSVYDGTIYPPFRVLEDFAITPYLIAKSNRVMAIPYVGYHYLKYDDSLSSNNNDITKKIEKLRIFKEVIMLTEQYINKTNISDEAKNIFISDINNRYKIREKKVLGYNLGE